MIDTVVDELMAHVETYADAWDNVEAGGSAGVDAARTNLRDAIRTALLKAAEAERAWFAQALKEWDYTDDIENLLADRLADDGGENNPYWYTRAGLEGK